MMSSLEFSPAARHRVPVILSLGFRPFFLGAGLWAVLAMALWVAMLAGWLELPTHFAPAVWHAHEFLFGYLTAVIAGFLLTAVPNWTRRPPVAGRLLGLLVGLWLLARLAVAVSAALPAWLLALVVLAMPLVLAAVLAREIVQAGNWRNLIVLAALGVFVLGDAVYLWEDAHGIHAVQGYGLRIGLAGAVMLTTIIGGRIVPAFTRNWLISRGPGRLPAPPMRRLDWWSLAVLALALLAWMAAPHAALTGLLLVLAGAVHALRLARWAGERTLVEPLLWVLHLGYAMIPLGALVIGAQILWPGLILEAAARHLWLGGMIGIMTLAMMPRVTLGHSGLRLRAGRGTALMFIAVALSVLLRVLAGVWLDMADPLIRLSGLLWALAFLGYVVLYAPILLRPRRMG